jgi:hypothetical protein
MLTGIVLMANRPKSADFPAIPAIGQVLAFPLLSSKADQCNINMADNAMTRLN